MAGLKDPTEVYEDKKMYELKVKGNFYRAEKLKLYSDGINLELGEGKILGHLYETTEMETEIPAEDAGMMPEECNARIEEEFDIEIPNEAAESIVTVADAVEQIKSALN